VALEVRQDLRLDAKLSVGAVQQEVQVTGDNVSAIETDSATISGTFRQTTPSTCPLIHAQRQRHSAANIFSAMPVVQADGDSSGVSCKAHCLTRWT